MPRWGARVGRSVSGFRYNGKGYTANNSAQSILETRFRLPNRPGIKSHKGTRTMLNVRGRTVRMDNERPRCMPRPQAQDEGGRSGSSPKCVAKCSR